MANQGRSTVNSAFPSPKRLFDIPNKFITHTYVLAVFWNLTSSATIVGLCFGYTKRNWISQIWGLRNTPSNEGDQLSILIAIFLVTIHSMTRLYQCLVMNATTREAKLTFLEYIWRLVYHTLLVPTLISESLPLEDLPLGCFEMRHFVGIAIFAVALYVQQQTYTVLADVKAKGHQDPHSFPKGRLFDFVTCPHYFAEVLIYVATMVIMSSQCRSWWLVLAYNVVIHAHLAMESHLWYKQTFPDYPKQRKALIPFII